MTMRKFVVSGVYRTGEPHTADKVDFEGVEGFLPDFDIRKINAHILNRVGALWVTADKRYPLRCAVLEQFFIDGEEEGEIVDMPNPIAGKSIVELDWLGLQMFAVQFNLFGVPVPMQKSLREAREKAYTEYCDKILDVPAPAGSFKDWPVIRVPEESDQADDFENLTLEDQAEAFASGRDVKEYTFEELKNMARARGINYAPNITYRRLVKKLGL